MKTKVISLPKRKQASHIDSGNDDEGKEKLSAVKCRAILQKQAKGLSDEDIIKIRDFLYRLAAIGWEEYQYRQQQAKIVHLAQHKTDKHEKSHYLRAG
jgi:hypothetical protein